MKTEKEILSLMGSNIKEIEKTLNIKIRNGQHSTGIKQALKWVIS